jgi:electron transport complex protein RnfC
MNLEPVFMYMYYSKGDFANMEKYHVMDCFECGSCSFNCPARMPLTHAFKTAKLMFQAKAAKEKAEAEAKAAKEAQK